jgi:hypothetical protein
VLKEFGEKYTYRFDPQVLWRGRLPCRDYLLQAPQEHLIQLPKATNERDFRLTDGTKNKKKRTFPSRLVNSPTKPLATQLPTPSGFFSFSHPRFPLTSLIRSDCGVQFVMAVLCDSVRTDDPMSWAMDVMVLLFCTGDEGERRGRYESRYSTFNQKGDCHWCCGPAVPLIAHLK